VSKVIKRLSSFIAHSSTFSKMVRLLEQPDRNQPNLLRVLTYHVVEAPAAFDQQMNYLAANYYVVSMPELLDVYERKGVLPPRSIMVTFDDAYINFVECAWPILKRHQLPVTLFVPTAFPDHPERTFWWEQLYQAIHRTARRDRLDTPLGQFSLATPTQREQAYGQLRQQVALLPYGEAIRRIDQICNELEVPPAKSSVLGWAALRQLAREGVTLGAHTQTHPLMNRISLDEVRAEATGSLRDLEREIGPVPPIFAYPGGGFNDKVVKVLEEEGFVLAFTTVRGANDLRVADPLRLRRNNIGVRATLNVLQTRLLQSSVYFNRLRPLSGT
jgi:peptidoglycan/xylan/chitin deacetylase (PgdA/CDA1 family)